MLLHAGAHEIERPYRLSTLGPRNGPEPVLSERSEPKGAYSGRHVRANLGWLDSNQRMAESKSAALPLGYTPS